MDRKLYVLVRKDLPKSQQAVQAGHAVAEFLLRGPLTFWSNGTLILLGVQDENHLTSWGRRLNILGIPFVEFKEPDIDNQTTAIATEGAPDLFMGLRLL